MPNENVMSTTGEGMQDSCNGNSDTSSKCHEEIYYAPVAFSCDHQIQFMEEDDVMQLIINDDCDSDDLCKTRTKTELKELEENLSRILTFKPQQAKETADVCSDDRSLKYSIKQPDDFTLFTTDALRQFVTLRKIFLKTAELSEQVGSTIYIPPAHQSVTGDPTQPTPKIQSWILTLIKMLQLTNTCIFTADEAGDSLKKSVNTTTQLGLQFIFSQMNMLKSQIEQFSTEFSRYKNLFHKVEASVHRCSSNICPGLAEKLKQSFAEIRDIENAKLTKILTPKQSEVLKLDDEKLLQRITKESDGSIYLQSFEKNGEVRQENFTKLSITEQVEVLDKYLLHFRRYLEDSNRIALECSTKLTSKPRKLTGKRCQSYLGMKLAKLKKLARKLNKCFPLEQTRCAHLMWQTSVMLQNIKLIISPLHSFICSLPETCEKIFGHIKFTLDTFNLFGIKNWPDEWNSYNELTSKFDFTEHIKREYWCNNIVAPSHDQLPCPLMFQLVESALTGIIDFRAEYHFRIERMSICQNVFMEDVDICSPLLQQLLVNCTILIKQFRHLYQELHEPKPCNFGEIVDETGSRKEVNGGAFVKEKNIINFWMFLSALCLQLTCSTESEMLKLKELENCLKMHNTFMKKIAKVYQKTIYKYKCIKAVLDFFENLKSQSEQLSKMQDYKLAQIDVKDELPPSETLINKSAEESTQPTNADISDTILIKIRRSDIIFTLPDDNHNILSYRSFDHKNRFRILDIILTIAKNLISSRIDFIDKNSSLLFQVAGSKTNHDNPAFLIREVQRVLHKPPNITNDLEILIAIRTLRYLQQEICYFLTALQQATESSKVVMENFPQVLNRIKQRKLIKVSKLLSKRKSICLHHETLARELRETTILPKHTEEERQIRSTLKTVTFSLFQIRDQDMEPKIKPDSEKRMSPRIPKHLFRM